MSQTNQNSNVRVETVTRAEDDDPMFMVTQAVNRTLDNRLQLMQEQSKKKDIAEAIKEIFAQHKNTQKKRKMPDLKSEGNKKRYKANDEVIENIDEALSELQSGSIEAAKTKLEAGKNILLKQQKFLFSYIDDNIVPSVTVTAFTTADDFT